MSGGDSNVNNPWFPPPADRPAPAQPLRRPFYRRVAFVLGLGCVIVFAVWRLNLLFGAKFYNPVGPAQWIWAEHEMSREIPVVFFATRDFDLPETRQYTRIKVLGDPEFILYFNGREVGGSRVRRSGEIYLYDVSELARTGSNRMVIAVRSTNGVGGLVAALDTDPEAENVVFTDRRWKIFRRWRPDLLYYDPLDLPWGRPMLLGSPPVGRWNYFEPVNAPAPRSFQRVIVPRASWSFKGSVPIIRVRDGIPIQTVQTTRAQAFDFGFVRGRVRLTINYDNGVSRFVKIRLTNTREETALVDWSLIPFTFAAGENVVVDSETHSFRYVVVYGGQATADVIEESAAAQ